MEEERKKQSPQNSKSKSSNSCKNDDGEGVKMKIDGDVCYQCGTCTILFPEFFEMTDDGVDDSNACVPEDKVDEVKGVCPVGAIDVE